MDECRADQAAITLRAGGWISKALMGLLGLALAAAGVVVPLRDPGVAIAGGIFLVLGFYILGANVLEARPRVVYDATGIHVRGWRTPRVDLPWPRARAEFVAVEGLMARSTYEAVTQYRPADGSEPVRIPLPRCEGNVQGAASCALNAKLDMLWAWALGRGYVQVGERVPPADGDAGDAGRQDGVRRDTASVVLPAPLRFTTTFVVAPVVIGLGGLVMTGLCGWMLVGGSVDPQLDDLLRVVRQYGGVVGRVGITIILLSLVWLGLQIIRHAVARAATAVTIDEQGFHCRGGEQSPNLYGLQWWLSAGGLRSRTVPWPSSRQQLVVTCVYSSRGGDARAFLVDADGNHWMLPVTNCATDLRPELGLALTLDAIWDWGVRRGAARETGQYVPARDPKFEAMRTTSAERIAYLRRGR